MKNLLGIGDLVLRAGTVFAEGGQIHRVHADGSTSQGPPPDMMHLIGTVHGDPQSEVYLHISRHSALGMMNTISC